jgi:hypothetical protein
MVSMVENFKSFLANKKGSKDDVLKFYMKFDPKQKMSADDSKEVESLFSFMAQTHFREAQITASVNNTKGTEMSIQVQIIRSEKMKDKTEESEAAAPSTEANPFLFLGTRMNTMCTCEHHDSCHGKSQTSGNMRTNNNRSHIFLEGYNNGKKHFNIER